LEILRNYIQSKINIQPAHLDEILSSFDHKVFKSDRALVQKGQFVTKYYFIARGGARIVIETPEKEITAWLIFENNFFTDLNALRSGKASTAKILAIDETEIWSIDADKMNAYYERYPEWQKFGRLIMEDAFLNVVESLVSFQVMDAETRYLQILSKSDAINRVPLKQLASYLGVTPTSLSRIRKNIR